MNFKKEILNYIIFGIFTSIVNIATYLLLTDVFNVYYVFANILAWIISVFLHISLIGHGFLKVKIKI